MASTKFTVGPRVYNGGSYSPHVGKGSVDKQGYKERDTRAKLKRQMLQDQLKKRGKK